jgi:hypothetical protein
MFHVKALAFPGSSTAPALDPAAVSLARGR